MSMPMFVLAAVGLGIVLAAIGLVVAAELASARRRRRRRQRPLSDREVADALAPFGADISVWPSRAPRNGSAHEDIA